LVMTSNVGSAAISELGATNPDEARREAMEALRASFRPEFLNRVDEIVMFNPLSKDQLAHIVDLQLADIAKLLVDRNITLELTPAARQLVLDEGYDPAYGARPLRRTLQRLVQDPLAMQILAGTVLPGDHVIVDVDPATHKVKFVRKPAAESAAPETSAAAVAAASSTAPPASRSKKK
jgi:ATP-dependent Clp protease ATP-binding subunit ClpB